MSDAVGLGDAIATLASSPRVATAVASGSVALGAAGKLELFQGVLSTASLLVGFLTGTVVLAIQIIKLMRYMRSLHIEPKD